jgi:predicted metalloprotease with PDZ domain
LSSRWRLALGLATLLCVGCDRGAESTRSTGTTGSRAGRLDASPLGALDGSAALGSAAPGDSGTLQVLLRPRLQPQPGLSVIVELGGQRAAALTAFAITPRWAGTAGPRNVHDLVVLDAQGTVPVEEEAGTGRYALTRGPVGGRIRASYFAAAPEESSRFDLAVSAAGASAVGHSFLVLPEIADELPVRLRWDLTEYGPASGASSFGVGADVVARARPADLAHSVYVAGPLTVQDGGFGERLVLLGRPAFEPAAALRLCSEVLHGARQVFEPADRQPFTFAFVAQPHIGGDHDGASLYRSFAVWFDDGRRLDGRLRILIAHEVVHRWIGHAVRLTWPDGSDAAWFSEGVAAHYARTLLLRHRLIAPEDFVDDLNRSYDVQRRAMLEGRLAPRPADRSGEGSVGPKLPVDHAVGGSVASHRGSLYAGRLDAQLRRKRRGNLDLIMADLLARARSEPSRALPVSVWREVLHSRLGPNAEREFEQLMVQRSEPADIPFDALGECLMRTVVKDGAYELGFDEASLRGDRPVIRGVVSGSAAEAAGVQEGDLIVSGHETVRLGDANRTITLVVSGAKGTRLVRFNPQSTKPRVRWQVVPSCRGRLP